MNPDSDPQKKIEKPASSFSNQSDGWLLHAWKEGNELAAEILFDRYAVRLIALLAGRLNRRFRSEIDPDEVVQSAMGSFFNAARHSRIEVSEGVSLWRLLATFARRKLARRIERHSATKRGGEHTRVSLDAAELVTTKDGSREDLDDAGELLRLLKSELAKEHLVVVEGLLAGQTQRELATALGIDERTVRRRLARIREQLAPESTGEESSRPKSSRPKSSRPTNLPTVHYNQFVLGKLVGSGGFGKVYRASMQDDGRIVAVKFLRKAFWQNEDARASFLRELELASQVNHPGVIRYLGYGESPQGGPYLISEWIDGLPMHKIESRSTQQFIGWMTQVCDAIQAVHDLGLVHGDLTPSNILIDKLDRATITDFGFSQSSRDTPLGILGGTLGFAAPEQIDTAFGSINEKTDIYAIGGLIHWHYFSQPPNEGASYNEALSDTLAPDDAGALNTKQLPRQIKDVLGVALRKSAADRTMTATEISSNLAAAIPSER